MKLIRDINSKSNTAENVVATIGNFDGVHLGHQAILEKVLDKSNALNLPSMLIAFEPTTKEFFQGDAAPPRLTNFREKFSIIRNLGIDWYVCLRFNQTLAGMPAEQFLKNVLIENLRVKHLIVGDNFRFGKDRKGDFDLLQQAEKQYNFETENTETFFDNDDRISSSSIRYHLANGELVAAENLLGRSYSMSGRVIHGDKRGRTINFPTANIPIKRIVSPISGVFAVKVAFENEKFKFGVANIGHRPTVGGTRTQIEVHIFNFSQDIYGEHVSVFFCKKIREEKRFASFDALKKQISLDAEDAKNYFKEAA